ncbi:MAG TPA: nuclear transport factor 2 family protein [Capsulimonadaceae bacterium]|nr:nuclear transport factor 2 family protein [Capsulimonadaceae bacterium]
MLPRSFLASTAAAVFAALALAPGMANATNTTHRRDPSAQARKQIQAIYDREDAAASHKDIHGVFADMTPDFSAIDENGQAMSLAQAKANLADVFAKAATVKGSTVIEKFRLVGITAIVTTKSRDEMTVADPAGGQAGKVTVDDISVDTWVRSGTIWRQRRSRDISQSVHTDHPVISPSNDPMLS